jgi:hypothetical protein
MTTNTGNELLPVVRTPLESEQWRVTSTRTLGRRADGCAGEHVRAAPFFFLAPRRQFMDIKLPSGWKVASSLPS